MSYFIRASNKFIEVDHIQSVRVRESGVLNIVVGSDHENGLVVIMSAEEGQKHPFFKKFYPQHSDNPNIIHGYVPALKEGYDDYLADGCECGGDDCDCCDGGIDEPDETPAVKRAKEAHSKLIRNLDAEFLSRLGSIY